MHYLGDDDTGGWLGNWGCDIMLFTADYMGNENGIKPVHGIETNFHIPI